MPATSCVGTRVRFAGLVAGGLAVAACSGPVQDSPALVQAAAETMASQGTAASYDRQVFFGDLHLHTSFSLDAAAARTETTPDDAYRFARGEPISYLGRTHQRRAPLDFLAVTDHAEFLGNVRRVMSGEINLPGDQSRWDRLINHEGGADMFEWFGYAAGGLFGETRAGLNDPGLSHDTWVQTIEAAERNYAPGEFTTFVAFEYSPTFRASGAHLHRNVIFRGPRYPAMPFSAMDSLDPEDLWAYADNNRGRGIDSLMIPHNTNLSAGRAFAYTTAQGAPMTTDYAVMRRRNEPLVEITQIKGTSETTPALSPADEFAGFELINSTGDSSGNYVRSGMQRGIELAETLGINPFEQGFVGATDFHSGITTSDEDDYPGALGLSDDQTNAAAILSDVSPIIGSPLANLSAAGLTGVWAEANTRESIFAALRRRETFATSGPRMRVRMFGGWGSVDGLAAKPDWAEQAYRWGVPMGGNLSAAPAGASGPKFVVQAAKDPDSGNLDRIQIVKLWRENGQSRERIFDVVWSPGRSVLSNGRLEPVGNTVDASRATYTNTIGASDLFATWSDPDFDPSERALYYARVIEIPTPRWATYLSVASGIPLSPGTRAWLQERAWTSPIYYTP